MRNITNAFRRELYNDNRAYKCTITIQLTDNTELTVDESQIWQNGLVTNDNVSNESSFSALGSVIVNSGTLTLNNIYDDFSSYTFDQAKVVISVGLEIDDVLESVKLGTFTVDDTNYNGALITLYCLDNMHKFDKPYSSSSLVYPATLQAIVTDACTECGVLLQTTTFPNYNITIADRPIDEAITYREVISYAAVLAGCFARCNADGKLELKWFDITSLESAYEDMEDSEFDPEVIYADGNPITVHYLTSLSSQDVSTDDVIITGVRITTFATDIESTDTSHLYGNEGYVISIEKNPFITESNVATIGAYLQNLLVGLSFRKATISHLNDPSIEAGDTALVFDRKGNIYPILVTNTTFNISQYQRTISAAETPVKNSAVQYTEITKTEVESKKLVQQEKTLREQMGDDLTDAINAKAGMYETRVQEQGGGYTYYMHDKPLLADSTAVIKVTNEAVAVTPDYQAQTPTWYGLTVDGNFIANIMSVIGIDFDWGTGGTLVLGGQNNVNGSLTIKDASNNVIGTWDNSGITFVKGVLQSYDYSYTSGTYTAAGMIIDLNSKVIRTPKTAILSDGSIYSSSVDLEGKITATSGTVGGWEIGSGLYTGQKTAYGDDNDGLYLGSDGIDVETSNGYVRVAPRQGIRLKRKNEHEQFFIKLEGTDGGAYEQTTVELSHITIRGKTYNNNAYSSGNPQLRFENTDATKNCALNFTDSATVQSPASLTLTGNQGGEYFIAPNIKVTSGLYIGTASVANSITGITRSGTTFTATRLDGTTFTFTQQDNNTTYTAGTGLTLSGTQFNLSDNELAYRQYAKTVSTDFNSITAPGIYVLDGTTMTNAPSGYTWSKLIVLMESGWGQQIVSGNNFIYQRGFTGSPGAWSAWRRVDTLVKGDAETTYRSGDVNLTPANIGALALTGGTLTGNLVIGQTSDTVSRGVTSRNSLGNVGLSVGTDGAHGLYSGTKGGWLLYADKNANSANPNLYIPRPLVVGNASASYCEVNSGGTVRIRNTTGNAWVQAENGNGVNAIWMVSKTDGTVEIASRTTNGTALALLTRANNSTQITARGAWNFTGALTVTGTITGYDYSGSSHVMVGSAADSSHRVAYLYHQNATTVRVYGQAGGGSYTTYTTLTGSSSSDIRLKDHIKDSDTNALNLICQIEMKSFDWLPGWRDYTHQPIGMIADQIEKLDNRLVIGGGYDPDGEPNYKVIDDHYLACYLTKGVQELCDRIEMLENENKKLMTLVNKLLERI